MIELAARRGPPPTWSHGTRTGYTGHGCRCDDCRRANTDYQRAHYAKNPEKVCERTRAYREDNREKVRGWNRINYNRNREKVLETSRAYQARRRAIVHELKGTLCTDCKSVFESHELHFHHEDPATKVFDIGRWPTLGKDKGSLDALHLEVDKCVVLCHPCHTARHRAIKQAA